MLDKATILCAVALAVCVAALLVRGFSGFGVETDLYGLADTHSGGAMKEIAAGLAHQGRVLVEGPSARPPLALARAVAAELGQRQSGRFTDTLAYLSRHKDGLLAPETRELLVSGRFAKVAADAMAKLFGPVHPLFPVKDDPFLLATGYAMSLQSHLAEGWTLKDGFPACERDGRIWLLVTADLSEMPNVRIAEFLARAKAFNDGGVDFGVAAGECADGLRIWCGGPPFHSARTSERAKREINLLSVLSVAAVIGFGRLLLRSLRFLPSLLAALGVAALFAGAALFAAFPRPHVLTFVFGTSLIGLSVDYVYHAWAAGGARQVKRQLAYAMLTTVASFAPLLLASADVLRQMAVFTIAGLVAVWVWVMVSMGKVGNVANVGMLPVPNWLLKLDFGNIGYRQHLRRLRGGGIARIVVLMLAAAGICKLKVVHSPTAFYRPDAYLAQSEKNLAELNPGGNGKFAYVCGKTLQEALEREETAGIRGVSAVIPSIRRQKENRDLIAKLHAREGSAFSAKTGLKVDCAAGRADSADGDGGLLDAEAIEDMRLQGLVKAAWTGNGLASPCPAGFESSDPEILVLEPQKSLEEMFAGFTAATLRLLGFSLVAIVVLMALLFRRKAFRIAAPVLAALAATAGTLGWMGIPITFFTLLCVFVLVGLGMDYSIFQTLSNEGCESEEGGEGATSRAVFYSFLTSFVGLGALAFTDFAVTRDMGVTFAVGLAFAYVFARFPVRHA